MEQKGIEGWMDHVPIIMTYERWQSTGALVLYCHRDYSDSLL